MAIRKKLRDEETGEDVLGTVVEVVEAKERYSRVMLEDGTLIRVRPIVIEVVRLDKTTDDGKPTYKIEGQLVLNIHPPEEQPDD